MLVISYPTHEDETTSYMTSTTIAHSRKHVPRASIMEGPVFDQPIDEIVEQEQ